MNNKKLWTLWFSSVVFGFCHFYTERFGWHGFPTFVGPGGIALAVYGLIVAKWED